jgi:hypothetical protein
MKRTGRIILISLGLAALYLLLNGVAWAAVFFWKSEAIAICAAIPAMILCPAGAISVVPGSPADSPLFFIPLMVSFFLLWGIVIDAVWRKLKGAEEQRG